MAVASKLDFIRSLKQHLAGTPNLPKSCSSCGGELIYLHAQFQAHEEAERFTLPLGFCRLCDGLRQNAESAI